MSKKVILIGDSIRGGYQQRVRQLIGRRAEVWAPRANCGNSFWIRENLNAWVIDRDPDIVHFNCGIHDFGWMPGERVPRFTAGAYARNLRIIVGRLRSETRARLIFATSTPFLRPCAADLPKLKCTPAPIVQRYNAAARGVMKAHKVPVNDLFAVVMKAGVYDCICQDKIHMTPKGNEALARAVAKAIIRRL